MSLSRSEGKRKEDGSGVDLADFFCLIVTLVCFECLMFDCLRYGQTQFAEKS